MNKGQESIRREKSIHCGEGSKKRKKSGDGATDISSNQNSLVSVCHHVRHMLGLLQHNPRSSVMRAERRT